MANKSRAAALTDSFSPSPHLDAARSLLEPLGDALHLPELAAALHKAGLTIPHVPAKTPPGLAARSVSRSDTPLLLPIRVGLPIAAAPAMQPIETAGPFHGATGRYWLHFYDAYGA